MMKLKKIIFLMIGFFILCNNVSALSTDDANDLIDLNKKNNIILNYYYDDYELDDVNVDVYYVASIDENMQYQLLSNYLDYSIKINGIKTDDEWDILEDTLESYIVADDISETLSLSILDNKVEILDLDPGLYFIKTDTVDNENYSLLFDSFLLSVPGLNDSGNWDYDIEVYPKAKEFTVKYEKINYSVIKEWVDDKDSRPKRIDIEIYKDGLLVNNQVLSSGNNWTYQWEADDNGSEWTVVERNVPNGYNVSILDRDNKFIIVNTDHDYEEENPQTLDNINLYFYLFGVSLIGIVILMIIMFIKNKNVK